MKKQRVVHHGGGGGGGCVCCIATFVYFLPLLLSVTLCFCIFFLLLVKHRGRGSLPQSRLTERSASWGHESLYNEQSELASQRACVGGVCGRYTTSSQAGDRG